LRCEAIKGGGGQCKLDATHGSYCWSHSPETAETRRQHSRRGGKAGGNGRGGLSELAGIKREIRSVIGGVLDESLDRRSAAVGLQGYNALLKAVETERRIRETEDLERRLEELEESLADQSQSKLGQQ
jgi:hypothetical protein